MSGFLSGRIKEAAANSDESRKLEIKNELSIWIQGNFFVDMDEEACDRMRQHISFVCEKGISVEEAKDRAVKVANWWAANGNAR